MARTCTAEGCTNVYSCSGYCNKHYLRFKKYGTPFPPKPSFEERFWSKVEKTDGCWNWVAGRLATGYGSFDGNLKSHRVSYEMANGPIPDGMMIDHICHNRLCVNPGHLRLATAKENVENFTGLRSNNTSGYRGVSLHKPSGLWMAHVRNNGKIHASYHKTPELAAEAARLKRLELHTYNELDYQEAA